MRIAVCGTFGVGKSGISYRLAKRLLYPVVPDVALEVMRDFGYKTWEQYYQVDSGLNPDFQYRFFEVQLRIIKEKISEEKKVGNNFVSDASVIEPFVLLDLGGSVGVSETFETVYSHVLNNYDLIVHIWPYRDYFRSGFFNSDEVYFYRQEIAKRIDSFLYTSFYGKKPICELKKILPIKSFDMEFLLDNFIEMVE